QPCLLRDVLGQGTVPVAVARDVAVQPVDRVPVDGSDLLFAHESFHAVPRRGGLTTRHASPEKPTLRLPGRGPAAKLSGVPFSVPLHPTVESCEATSPPPHCSWACSPRPAHAPRTRSARARRRPQPLPFLRPTVPP